MVVRMSSWDGKTLTLVKESKVETLSQIIGEVTWYMDNHIDGEFALIPENKEDEVLLGFLEKYRGKTDEVN